MALYRRLPIKAPDILPDGTSRKKGKFEGVNWDISTSSRVTEANWGRCVSSIGAEITDCLHCKK